MPDALDILLERSSEAIGRPIGKLGDLAERLEPIRPLLERRNGFWAGLSALYILPFDHLEKPNLELTDAIVEYAGRYEALRQGTIFGFDLYGMPFLFNESGFGHLNYETGEVDAMGSSVNEWAQALVGDFGRFTAWPVAEAWQEANGPIPKDARLYPVRPFIMGGEYDISNLRPCKIEDGFGAASQIYQQTKDLPEGAQVRIVVSD
ncbi:hypothetical protein [Maricaulis sp.]|uniref:hypothetical protein n=1 Tax=Maricaulis sp. TaxID=1486257 RepID=UPI002611FE3E|nr:hypothetical protein [Maricaulis sp.]